MNSEDLLTSAIGWARTILRDILEINPNCTPQQLHAAFLANVSVRHIIDQDAQDFESLPRLAEGLAHYALAALRRLAVAEGDCPVQLLNRIDSE